MSDQQEVIEKIAKRLYTLQNWQTVWETEDEEIKHSWREEATQLLLSIPELKDYFNSERDREVLPYLSHKKTCPLLDNAWGKCTCGLEIILSKMEADK